MSLVISNPNRDFEFVSGLGSYEVTTSGNYLDFVDADTTGVTTEGAIAIRRKGIGASYDQCIMLPYVTASGDATFGAPVCFKTTLTGTGATDFMFKARVRVMQLTHNKMYDITKANDYSFKLLLAVTKDASPTQIEFQDATGNAVVDDIETYREYIVHPNEGWIDLYLFCNTTETTLHFCVLPTVDQDDTVLLLDSWHVDYSEYE